MVGFPIPRRAHPKKNRLCKTATGHVFSLLLGFHADEDPDPDSILLACIRLRSHASGASAISSAAAGDPFSDSGDPLGQHGLDPEGDTPRPTGELSHRQLAQSFMHGFTLLLGALASRVAAAAPAPRRWLKGEHTQVLQTRTVPFAAKNPSPLGPHEYEQALEEIESKELYGKAPEKKTIFVLADYLTTGRLNLTPDFQRGFVWKKPRQSRLVSPHSETSSRYAPSGLRRDFWLDCDQGFKDIRGSPTDIRPLCYRVTPKPTVGLASVLEDHSRGLCTTSPRCG